MFVYLFVCKNQVTLKYNKLEADVEQGKTMDILVKKKLNIG